MTFNEWWAEYRKNDHVNTPLWERQRKRKTAKAAWLAAQPQWRPIETAPRDGSEILVVAGNNVLIAFYIAAKSLSAGFDFNVGWAEYDKEAGLYYCPAGWYETSNCDHVDIIYRQLYKSMQPTHWMPLPEPPKDKEQE